MPAPNALLPHFELCDVEGVYGYEAFPIETKVYEGPPATTDASGITCTNGRTASVPENRWHNSWAEPEPTKDIFVIEVLTAHSCARGISDILDARRDLVAASTGAVTTLGLSSSPASTLLNPKERGALIGSAPRLGLGILVRWRACCGTSSSGSTSVRPAWNTAKLVSGIWAALDDLPYPQLKSARRGSCCAQLRVIRLRTGGSLTTTSRLLYEEIRRNIPLHRGSRASARSSLRARSVGPRGPGVILLRPHSPLWGRTHTSPSRRGPTQRRNPDWRCHTDGSAPSKLCSRASSTPRSSFSL